MSRIDGIKKLTHNKFLNMYELDAVNKEEKHFKYFFASRGDGENLKCKTKINTAEGVVVYGICKDNPDKIVLIRQYRYPINDYIYELPAGLIDSGENASQTAKREYEEETGMIFEEYLKGNEAFRKPFYTTVGLTDESVCAIFGYAIGQPSKEKLETTEEIEVVLADKKEVKRILREEKVAMKCALLLMQFLQSNSKEPFQFLNE